MTKTNQGFTLVEEELMKTFCRSLNPNFHLISADAMKNRSLEAYVNLKPTVGQFMRKSGNGKLSFTTDLWTSPQNYAMMAVTGGCLSLDFFMFEALLAFREIRGQHTGVNICKLFLDVMYEYGLQNKVSKRIVTYKHALAYFDDELATCFSFF